MNRNDHIKRHQELHTCFDELTADYLIHNRGSTLSGTSILNLMQWSYEQTNDPTNNEGNHESYIEKLKREIPPRQASPL